MDADALQRRLRAVFVEELEEHRDIIATCLVETEAGRAAPDTVTRLFRSAHTLKGASRSVGLDDVADLCHRAEHLLAVVRDGGRRLDGTRVGALGTWVDALDGVRRALIRGDEPDGADLSAAIASLAAAEARGDDEPTEPVATSARGDRRVAGTVSAPGRTEVTNPSVRLRAADLDALDIGVGRLVSARRRGRGHLRDVEALHRRVDESRSAVERAERRLRAAEDETRPWSRRDRRAFDDARAAIERLDRDVHALAATMRADARRFERSVAGLEGAVRRARLVPFAEACIGLERVLGDAAAAMGVQARFALTGHDVALDRAVAYRLNTPLQHLVRNAVAHGIEAPDEREASGRERTGTVSISAVASGTRIRVEVCDDGRGIDVAAVLERARSRGMRVLDDDPTAAAHTLLFEPGFTTRDHAGALAGRGVGLDVVRAEIEALQGTVVLVSTPGTGTCITIELPTTVTTCKTLFVRACRHVWGIPSSAVDRVLPLGDLDIDDAGEAQIDGARVPLIDAGAALALPACARPPTVVVMLQTATRVAGLVVSEVLDEDDVMIKPLGSRFDGISLVDAATRRDDGSLAFLLRVPTLVQSTARVRPQRGVARQSSPRPGRRLLVVDDSLTVRALVRSILEEAGYAVTVAVDGADALDRVRRHPFDLVVSDFEMPRLDGEGFTRAVRADPNHAGLPIVLLTGRDDDDAMRRGRDAGASAWLTKNTFDQTELIACIRRLLNPPSAHGGDDDPERHPAADPGADRG